MAAFKILSLTLVFSNETMMCASDFVIVCFVLFLLGSLSLEIYGLMYFIFMEFLTNIFENISSALFSHSSSLGQKRGLGTCPNTATSYLLHACMEKAFFSLLPAFHLSQEHPVWKLVGKACE